MRGALCAIAPGPFVTIQDAGRRGWRRFGVSCSGAMDIFALSMVNALVGNAPDAPALEFAHVGGAWEIGADSCRIAVTGSFAVSADGAPLASWQSHTLRRGQRIDIGGAPDAVWGYLAVAGGFDLAPQLGSHATHLRSGLGGIGGRYLVGGDTLPLRAVQAPGGRERRVAAPRPAPGPLRVVLGPQDDFFTRDTVAAFLAAVYHVTHRGDRMGTWLSGPAIAHAKGYNVLSDGLVPGCIQVPGSGQPVVLLKDCQTTGGYPKLATIITADLPRFVQTRPGKTVTFIAVDIGVAQGLYSVYRTTLDTLEQEVKEVDTPSARPFWLRG